MTPQLETPLPAGFGFGLCLHQPGHCPEGSICSITSVTEFPLRKQQAREILLLARRQLASGEQQERPAFGVDQASAAAAGEGAAQSGLSYPRGAVLGQKMKRSLQRFLEKRATRSMEVSSAPYAAAEKLRSTWPGESLLRL